MSWTCEQTEAQLSDYLEGALAPAELTAFRAHVPDCERCAPLLAEISSLVTGLHSLEQLETPPRLVYSILDKTLGPRETATGWQAALGWIRAIASIRFAYGALSVAATLIIFVTAAGFNWKHPRAADLSPTNLYRNADRQAHLVYARTSKFVNDLRVVNEIQTRLQRDNEIPTAPESTAPQSNPQKDPGRTDGSKPAGPRQQNRANDLARQVQVLAAAIPSTCTRMSGLMISRSVL
jgi:anti-sigma factor RsiW